MPRMGYFFCGISTAKLIFKSDYKRVWFIKLQAVLLAVTDISGSFGLVVQENRDNIQ